MYVSLRLVPSALRFCILVRLLISHDIGVEEDHFKIHAFQHIPANFVLAARHFASRSPTAASGSKSRICRTTSRWVAGRTDIARE